MASPSAVPDFQHISDILHERYSAEALERRRNLRVLNHLVIVASIIVVIATPAAMYWLTAGKLLYAGPALVVALAAAFGPKLYLVSIPRNRVRCEKEKSGATGVHRSIMCR
jgi:hypothetical protein